MIEVKIRYNTLVNDDFLYWRVLIKGVEHLASHVEINTETKTTKDYIEGIGFKHHITCYCNQIIWDEETKSVILQ